MNKPQNIKTILEKKVSDLTAAYEVGKIFNAIFDHATLLNFFLTITTKALEARSGVLYWVKDGKLAEVDRFGSFDKGEIKKLFSVTVKRVEKSARPFVYDSLLAVPLIVRDTVIGVVSFKYDSVPRHSSDKLELAMAYANQAAGAIKNLELYEENLKFERLAAIGQTLSVLSHEIRNILQSIQHSEYIVDKGLEKGDIKRVGFGWEHFKKNSGRLNDFALDMLRLTKDRNPVYKDIDLNKFLEDIARDVRERASKGGIKLKFKSNKKIAAVKVDPQGIHGAVLNLLVNAIDACKKGDSVELSSRLLPKGRFEIRVSDTGAGISPNDLPKIFQIFFSTKPESGTGLGLALVEKTVREHNGKIDVKSRLGKGTTFIVTLPLGI